MKQFKLFILLLFMSISITTNLNAQIATIEVGVSLGSNRDHDFAISNGGWRIDASNNEIAFNGGTPTSFPLFMALFGGTSRRIDPDILYDPSIDRFFLVTMILNSQSGGIVLLRSKTATPNANYADWESYTYTTPTNAFLDFPRLTVNQNKVLVSFKFRDVSALIPCFFMLDKMTIAGPAETVLPTVSSDMEFLCPVIPATTADFNATDFRFIGMDKVCTNGSNRIFSYRLSANNTLTEEVLTSALNYYSNSTGNNSSLGLNGGSTTLWSNRAWAAVIRNNAVHFVSHIINANLNQSSIYYGIIDVNTHQLTSTNLIKTGESRFYPSMALATNPNNANLSMPCINFLAQTSTETLWKTYVNDGITARDYTIARYQGLGIPSNLGDYTAAQRQYNHPYNVWLSGQLPTAAASQQGYSVLLDNSNRVLPLELLNFKAQLIAADHINLKWTTLNEARINHFDVQRLSGKSWETVGTIKANNTNNRQNYSFDDANIKNTEGVLYYRLRIAEQDSSVQYSPISAIAIPANTSLSVYPNPANDGITITSSLEGKANIEIRDVVGHILFNKELSFTNKTLYLPIEQLITKNGVYTVHISQNNQLMGLKTFVVMR
jgi:hypothetical protein